MKTGKYTSWQLRLVSWAAFGLTWLVLLCYIGLIIWNGQSRPLDLTNPQALVTSFFQLIALPGLPASPPADGLLFVLACGIFVLALRSSPRLLRPEFKVLQPSVPTLNMSAAPSVETLIPPLSDKSAAALAVAPMLPASGFVPHVFISHSSHDNTFGLALAHRLAEALGSADNVWYDACGDPDAHCEGLRPGESWWEGIQRELTGSNVFILIMTTEALESPWVRQEIETAHIQAQKPVGKIVIPLFLADPSTLAIPPFLARIQGVSFASNRWDNEAFAELLVAVRLGFTRFKGLEPASERLGPPFILADLPQVDHLIGRDRELNLVLQALRDTKDDRGRVASIFAASGFPGIGKSALAGRAARVLRAEGSFPGGIVTISCKRASDPILLLQQVVAAFDPAGRTPDTSSLSVLARLLTATFNFARALVILDNVEPQLPVDDVVGILRDAGAATLLTSRQEILSTRIPPSAHIQLQLLSPDAALEMFVLYYLLGEAQLTPVMAIQAKRIVKALGFHTLAVKLAARIARTRDLTTYADELEHDPRLAVGLKEGDESVRVVLESSYKSLPETAQQVFVSLAIFRSSDVGRKAILTLAATLLGDSDSARDTLEILLNYGLVDTIAYEDMPDEGDHERVLLHPLVHAFVSGLFVEWNPERQSSVYEAAVGWYVNYVASLSASSLVYDQENIIGILEDAHNHQDVSSEVLLCTSLSELWLLTGNIRELISYIPWGIQGAQEIERHQSKNEDEKSSLSSEAVMAMSLGTALGIARRFSDAKATLQHSLRLFERLRDDKWYGHRFESSILARLGEIAVERGDSDEAKTLLDEALHRLNEAPDNAFEYQYLTNITLGDIALNRGDFGNAKNYLLQGLSAVREAGHLTSEAGILSALSAVALRANQLDEAQGYAEQALPLAQDNHLALLEGVVLHRMGDIALQRSLPDEAEHYLLQALPLLQRSQAVTQQVRVLCHLGDIEQSRPGETEPALKLFDRALTLDPTYIAGWRRKGEILADMQRYEDALQVYNQILVLDTKDVSAWNRKGNMLDGLQRYGESLSAYEQALFLTPGDPVIWSNKGSALSSLHRYEEAFQAYRQAIEIDPNNATAWNGKGAAFYHLQRYEEALAPFGQALTLDPKFALAWGNKGSALYLLSRYDEALQAYDQALTLDPKFAFVWEGKGAVLHDLQRYDEAVQAYDQALVLNPMNANTRNRKGNALHALQRYDEALQAYEQALTLNPQDAVIWANKGNTLCSLQRYETAVTAYEQALSLDPKYAFAWNRKGNALYALQRYDEALQAYEQALMYSPQDAFIWYNKGTALHSLHRYEEMLAAFEQTLALDSSYIDAWYYKGDALSHLRHYAQALVSFEQALALDPKVDYVWVGQGHALYELERYDEAVEAYNQALALDPEYVAAQRGKTNALRYIKTD